MILNTVQSVWILKCVLISIKYYNGDVLIQMVEWMKMVKAISQLISD